VKEKKPASGANEDSKTGKVKGGHDESGQPKDDKLKGNQKGGKTEGKKDGKSDKESKSEKPEDDEENEEEDKGQQAFGNTLWLECLNGRS
jgi:hypothetical protein